MTHTIHHGDRLDALRALWWHLTGVLPQTPTLGQDLDDLADWLESGEGK